MIGADMDQGPRTEDQGLQDAQGSRLKAEGVRPRALSLKSQPLEPRAFSLQLRSVFRRNGQSLVEYAILTGIITASLMAMQLYSKRSIQAIVKLAADGVGTQSDGIRQESGEKDRGDAPGTIIDQQSYTATKKVFVHAPRDNWPDTRNVTHAGHWDEYYGHPVVGPNVTETIGDLKNRPAPEACVVDCTGLQDDALTACAKRRDDPQRLAACQKRAAVASSSTSVTDE